MKLPRLALAAALLPAAPFADAAPPGVSQDDALKLSDTLISANREVQPRDDSPAASTVFTREDIERLQPRSLNDLLGRVPGLQVVENGGLGSQTSLYLRGTRSAQTLVLVDGMRIASASSGDSNLQHLDIEQIERVEVLRGSRSAIHGADAIGGVIQIFTRRGEAEGLAPWVRLAHGSRATWQRGAGLSGGDGATRFSLGSSLDDTHGIDRTRDSFASDADHDAYRDKSFSLALSHRFGERLETGVNLIDQRGRNEYDNPFGYFDPLTHATEGQRPYSDFHLSSASAYLDANLAERWNSRLEAGHSENRERSRDTLHPGTEVFNTYRDALNWLNTLTLDDRQSLLLGADLYEDRLNSSTAYGESSRWNEAAFVQHRYQGDGFSTEVGLRHDRNQQFGGENTWSGALTVPLDQANDLVFSYAEGFRAPTFNDLYYPDYGNPDLKPEHSRSYEVQWRGRLAERTRLEVSLYRTDIEDAIANDARFIPRNIAEARIHGAEASLRQELFGWQGALAVAFVDPRDRDTGHTLNRRARRTLGLDLDRRFGEWSVGGTWQAASSSFNDADNRQRIGGHGLLGLRGAWQASPGVKLDLRLDNLLDRDYTRALYRYEGDVHGYRQEGRGATLGVTWTPAI